MFKETLLKIGLSEKEADTYLLILESGEMKANDISRKGNESRTHTYDTLGKLIKKSLVTYVVKNNIKYFKAVDPQKLLDYLKEKEDKIKKEEVEIRQILPKLKQLQSISKKDDSKIEIYEGSEGLKTVLNDIIRTREDFVTWGATSKFKDHVPDFVVTKYLRERMLYKIHARQLFTDFYGVLESSLSQNRKLPKEFASPTTTLVYGKKVLILLWTEIPKAVVIESKDLAKSYKKHFELMWAATS